jgi:hypothetical protein
MSNKSIVILVIFGVLWGAVIGIDKLIIPSLIAGAGWLAYVLYKSYQSEISLTKYQHLDGKHTVQVKTTTLDGKNLVAEITYNSAGDGMIDVDLLREADGVADIREMLSNSEWHGISQELKKYFADLRGHPIPIR